MKRIKNKCALLLGPLLAIASVVSAQNMSLPYSVYGIGDIDHRYYNFNSGMGYSGIGLKSNLLRVGNNPASIAGLEKSFFTVDASAAGRIVTYTGNPITAENQNNSDFTIKRLALSSKFTSWWGSSVGMRQFSKVSYQFQSSKQIEGSNDSYAISYSGNGGLNEYFWNNGFAIGKHLSAGVTASFISGPINQVETLVDQDANVIESTRRDYYGNGKLEYGLIYSTAVSKNWNASLGGRFANKTKMNYERALTVVDNSTTIIDESFLKYSAFSLPRSYGAGLALSNKSDTRTFAADYSFDNWSALHVKGANWKLVDSRRLSAGAEFSSFVNSYSKNVMKKSFQLGAFINNSYLQVNNQPINEWGVTAGLTRSLKSNLRVGASVEAGVRGTTNADLIKENYVQFTINLSYRDFLFSKGRRYN